MHEKTQRNGMNISSPLDISASIEKNESNNLNGL